MFPSEPVDAGEVMQALFDDTCGNRILIYEVLKGGERLDE